MENKSDSKLFCETCKKYFTSSGNRNKHIRNMHPEIPFESKLQKHIICPLCKAEPFSHHQDLVKHLTSHHEVKIESSDLKFANFEEFTVWKAQENRDVDYICIKSKPQIFIYSCNRSDLRGFVSTCSKRRLKTGGSIKMTGVCPSRIEARVLENGELNVHFIKTHVGHEMELRNKRLSKNEEQTVVDQLMAGVSTNRILKDARKLEGDDIQRKNLLTSKDLSYMKRKFNIDKIRHPDDLMATYLKIEEWNQHGKNFGFLFKKIGEGYPGLHAEDFAVGFMNGVMEKKLRENKRVICMDGTHGTNQRNWDLTTILIKDEMNEGFPVAFLLSNRVDQKIQEVFLTALRSRLGGAIEAEYLMSDDDPKYFNAWVKAMDPQKKTKRLLCTWHVVKNWNIQSRTKIKNDHIRNGMKSEMRKILQETSPLRFEELKNKYLKYLEDEGENVFLQYLTRYYFQSQERIMMWAHCYRRNAGINTNMAIESLNKYLKYNKMQGKQNIRVEKLLDMLEEIIEEKMWKKIIQHERPTANNYQIRINVDAHEKAKIMGGGVEVNEDGTFNVKSTSDKDRYYTVSANETCDEDCRTGYCNECKICLHRYRCDCSSNSVKTVLCKHIHAVAMFKQWRVSASSGVLDEGADNLIISVPSTSSEHYNADVQHFIQQTCSTSTQNPNTSSDSIRREIFLTELNSCLSLLDTDEVKSLLDNARSMLSRKDKMSRKRKHEKQTYYPKKNSSFSGFLFSGSMWATWRRLCSLIEYNSQRKKSFT